MQQSEKIEELLLYFGEVLYSKGYDWKQQLFGLIITGDPIYIPTACRERAAEYSKEDYIDWLLSVFFAAGFKAEDSPKTALEILAYVAEVFDKAGHDALSGLKRFIIEGDFYTVPNSRNARCFIKKYDADTYVEALLDYATSVTGLKRIRQKEEARRQKEKDDRIKWLKEQIIASENQLKHLGLFNMKEKAAHREVIKKHQDELNKLL